MMSPLRWVQVSVFGKSCAVPVKYTTCNDLKGSLLVLGMQGAQSARPCGCCFEHRSSFGDRAQAGRRREESCRRMSLQHFAVATIDRDGAPHVRTYIQMVTRVARECLRKARAERRLSEAALFFLKFQGIPDVEERLKVIAMLRDLEAAPPCVHPVHLGMTWQAGSTKPCHLAMRWST